MVALFFLLKCLVCSKYSMIGCDFMCHMAVHIVMRGVERRVVKMG